MTQPSTQLPATRPTEHVQRMSLEPVVAGALVVGLGLWLLERGKEPTHLIWVGVSLICGPWLPLTLYQIGRAHV